MSEVLRNIKTRRSVRAFQDEQLTKEQLELILTAALYAPSGHNRQSWQFTVVQKPEQLERLRAAIGEALGNPDYGRFYNAPTLILVSTPRDNPLGPFDAATALENIFLEAHELGVGSVWINQMNGNCDHPAVRKTLDELKVPGDHVVWGAAALGYAAKPAPADRENRGKVVYA